MITFIGMSNKKAFHPAIYSKDQLKLMEILIEEKKKSENISQKSKTKTLKEIKQDKVLSWFFKLSLEDRIKMSTINNSLLSQIIFQLYKENKGIAFKPRKELAKIELEDEKGNRNESIEKEFLEKFLNIISSDINIITLNEEILSDSEKFKKCFKSLTNDKYFSDLLFPVDKQSKMFILPSWMSDNENLTFCQKILGFFEQNIILNYEYFYFKGRIYHSYMDHYAIEIYEEIQNTVKYVESCLFDDIFSQTKFNEAIINMKLNNKDSTKIFNELKNQIEENKREKEKIIKLLKKLTFLNLEEIINERFKIYSAYKNFILDYLRSQIVDELQKSDIESKKQINSKKRNKKKKDKQKKEVKENQNNKKEEENQINKEEDEKQLNIININQEKDKINEDTKGDKIEEESIDENENKKYKEFQLFSVIPVDKKKKKGKKKKTNKKKEENKELKSNHDDELKRIISNNSLSTCKSSNPKEDSSNNIKDGTLIITNLDNNKMKNGNISDNNSGNNVCSNEKLSTPFLSEADIISDIHDFYQVGIENYCAKIDTNVVLLDKLKDKYLKIISDMIKLNLGNKFSMKFGIYGSYATELSIEGSDIDVGIYYEKLSKDNLNFQQELYNFLKENEKTQNELSYETIPIFTASIPRIIVKIKIDENTKRYINNYGDLLDDDDMKFIKIDFTYNENEGYYKKNMENVDYIKNILIEYPQMKPVVQIGKRYLKRHKKNEVYTGGISSYSLFLMVLSIIIMSEIVLSKKKKIKSWYLLFSLFEIFSGFNFYWYGINEKHEYFPFGFKNDGRPFIMDPLTGLNICSNGSCSGSKINSIFKKGYDDLESAKQSYKKKFEKELSWGNNPFYEYRPIQSIVNLIKGEVE